MTEPYRPHVRLVTLAEARRLDAAFPYDPNAIQCKARGFIGGDPFVCTRAQGHEGPHVASAPKGPIATWNSTPAPVLDAVYCPYCGRRLSVREAAEQAICDDCRERR